MAKDVITRFKLETTQYDSKLRDAAKGLSEFSKTASVAGSEFDKFTKKNVEAAKAFGSIATSSTDAKGKVKEMVAAYNELAKTYNMLSKQQQQSDFGKAMASSLTQLKGRIAEAKQEMQGLGDVSKNIGGGKFGEFGNIIDTLGSKLGITGNLTEMLTSKTAMLTAGVSAAVAVIGKATEAWVLYNNELSKQDQITRVTTGLSGVDSNKMTDTARALVDTYNVDFRETINAANTLMTQFGKSGTEAIELIKDGMQGMIQGDGGKLLTMIQQFAPAFRDAGISASQLVAIIQNSEGGIFTDQNMNAIVMGIKNIRLMTKATGDALAKVGIDSEEMTRKLNDGSMSIFEALKVVSGAISSVGTGSQSVGEVMQYVFGRQGVTAGANLGKAIEELNTNLDETKRQTGELGEAFADLQVANENLNVAIREAFGYDGWQQMATGIESELITALANVIEKVGDIRDMFSTMGEVTSNALGGFINWLSTGYEIASMYVPVLSQLASLKRYLTSSDENQAEQGVGIGAVIGQLAQTPQNVLPEVVITPTPKGKSTSKGTPPPTYAPDSIAAQNALVADLKKKWTEAGESMRNDYLVQLIAAEAQLKKINDEQDMLRAHAGGTLLPKSSDFQITNLSNSEMFNPFSEDNEKAELNIPLKLVLDEASMQAVHDHMNGLKGDAKDAEKAFGLAASSVGNVGNALASIEDPTAKAAGTILQAIASIALGFAQASQAQDTVGSGWGWIAWLAAGTAALATTISTVHSLTGMAEGGIVQGNTYSGDNVYAGNAMVNVGELVLNRAQQGNLAAQLIDNRPANIGVSRVSGEQIYVALGAYLQRTGRGELVTWK